MKPVKQAGSLSLLLVGTQMAVGGAQKVLLSQARWFHDHGFSVSVAFFYDRDHLHEKWQHAQPFPIHNLRAYQPGDRRIRSAFRLAGGLLRFWSLIRRDHINVIEAFTHDSNLLSLPVAWLAGVKVRLATHHGVLEKIPPWHLRLHAWIVNIGLANRLIVVTRQLQLQARKEGVKESRIVIIPNGIELPEMSPGGADNLRTNLGISAEDAFLLSVGRLTHQKGHAVLIQAMAIIAQHHPKTVLCIAGEGPLRKKLESEIAKLELGKRVKLLGEREDINQLMSGADIFILPSRSEGLPLVLLEAMAASRPVIATRTGGIEDVIEDGVNGLLVKPDDPVEMAEAVCRYLDDPSFVIRLGAAARQRVETSYTLDRMCEEYLDLMKNPAHRPGSK